MLRLPDFPWNALEPLAARARAHPEGIVDLSVGSPVDPSPAVVRDAVIAASDAHAYPQTIGTPALREAIVAWYARRRGVHALTTSSVLPSIGSKEVVASLPLMLGLGPADAVVLPEIAYPTYAIGADVVGARKVASDDPASWPGTTRLVWLNSPGNPDGRVLGVDELRAAVARARELGAVIVSDECYAELNWSGASTGTGASPSILDPRIVGDDPSGVLALYSLSKQSNLAGYRAGIIAGDAALVVPLLEIRKHLGLIVPAPVQATMAAALSDDEHVDEQRERYRARRELLLPAVVAAGFRIDHSDAGLYLWATRDEDGWHTLEALAELGILAAPGSFYGDAGARHVRIALTASDERIAAAAARLAQL